MLDAKLMLPGLFIVGAMGSTGYDCAHTAIAGFPSISFIASVG